MSFENLENQNLKDRFKIILLGRLGTSQSDLSAQKTPEMNRSRGVDVTTCFYFVLTPNSREVIVLRFFSKKLAFFLKKIQHFRGHVRSDNDMYSSQKSIIFRTEGRTNGRNSSFEPPYERQKRFAQ